jgi:hypothetical protein
MKTIIGAFTVALFIVCLALPNLVFAGAEGDSATGSFKFASEDGETKFIEFKANELADGQATGDLTFSDPSAIPVEDPDSEDQSKIPPGVLVRAKLDCMDTSKNTAVIGGEIYDSNVPSAIGLRVLFVVQDNGTDGENDKLTWGVYQQPGKWIPTDAEVPEDKGASLTWLATDSELKDDAGISMPLNKVIQCKTFAGAAYEFPQFKYAGGDLVVQAK